MLDKQKNRGGFWGERQIDEKLEKKLVDRTSVISTSILTTN
jgi:hypothetical protein